MKTANKIYHTSQYIYDSDWKKPPVIQRYVPVTTNHISVGGSCGAYIMSHPLYTSRINNKKIIVYVGKHNLPWLPRQKYKVQYINTPAGWLTVSCYVKRDSKIKDIVPTKKIPILKPQEKIKVTYKKFCCVNSNELFYSRIGYGPDTVPKSNYAAIQWRKDFVYLIVLTDTQTQVIYSLTTSASIKMIAISDASYNENHPNHKDPYLRLYVFQYIGEDAK